MSSFHLGDFVRGQNVALQDCTSRIGSVDGPTSQRLFLAVARDTHTDKTGPQKATKHFQKVCHVISVKNNPLLDSTSKYRENINNYMLCKCL
jgi:hypothetical protein